MAYEFLTVHKAHVSRLLNAKAKQLKANKYQGKTDWTAEDARELIESEGQTLAQWWLSEGKKENLGVVVTIVGEWPAWMPTPLQQNFTIKPVDTRTISQMEVGTSIRKQFSGDELEATGSVLLDQDSSAWFERFEKETLEQGTTWFYFPVWSGGNLQTQLVRFKQRPTLSQVNSLHSRYDFVLQVEKRSFLNDSAYALLQHLSPTQAKGIAGLLHSTLHRPVIESYLLLLDAAYASQVALLARATWLLPELPPLLEPLAGLTFFYSSDEDYGELFVLDLLKAVVTQLNETKHKGRTDWTMDSFMSSVHAENMTLDEWWWRFGSDFGLPYSIYFKNWPAFMAQDPLQLTGLGSDLDREDAALLRFAGSTRVPARTPWNGFAQATGNYQSIFAGLAGITLLPEDQYGR